MHPRQRARKHIVKQRLVHKQHDCGEDCLAIPGVYISGQQRGLFVAECSLHFNIQGTF